MTPTLTTHRDGLTTAQAAALRERHGRNELPAARPPSVPARVGAQLRDPLIVVLLAAMVVTALLRDISDLVVILLVIVLNTTVGVVQELRADRAVAALRRMAAPSARVRRDGTDVSVPAGDLVPDDLVRVEAGDIVPADLRIVEAVRLTADESALTGESMTVAKDVGGELSAGTVTATGRATGIVLRTGPHSALGRIAALVAGQPRRATPLQRRLAGLGKVLAAAAVALSAVVFLVGVLRGQPVAEMLLAAVSLTVAAVPESLPAVVTLALALGARRMAQRSAIVRRLPAVETLGSVTVLATDKTGTLTEGLMSVERFLLPDRAEVALHGTGYDPAGSATPAPGDAALELARAVVLCTDADLAAPGGERTAWAPVGDPMEAALLAAAGRCGIGTAVRERYPRVDEVPFDADRRRMTTVHADPDGGHLIVCKGAPDGLLAPGGPVDADDGTRAWATRTAAGLAGDGYRVLAVATAHRDGGAGAGADDVERGLRLLGLVALVDPVRDAAPDTVRAFHDAGIQPVLITGDHPATAAAIAERVGIAAPGARVALGDDRVDPGAPAVVYARTSPERKLAIIKALQRGGAVVAMTGDGVNDAPALRRADIGVAMGRGGTEAARQAADLVLADDNLATVATAVREGRRIYANIRRFLVYALSGGAAEVLIMLAGPWLGLAVPLLPAQILWINMITHGLPGVALGGEPAAPGLMRRPPRRPDQAILARLAAPIAVTGALITVTALAAALWTRHAGGPWQSVLFLVLGLAQLGVALALRARGTGRRNWGLDAAVGLSLVLQLAAVWLAPLHTLLGTEALTLTGTLGCAAVAAVPGLVTYLRSAGRR
ncbi:cation-transporting P-type ATPase [Dactylosporangium aurantiacum]|uniref:Cation-transporting P-type ATPase n=1 Tax=Dactylosporangium aurantiacum TaxID=35754 RepID=A0A9Q9MMB0_9ACTN|nr:cation-transporting P-type ATPase [Dactylosporangium aurantiacum]MDG6105899.1 cation-transporting P-type ATPase [Dactylosporangium aurantiacum]UWZ57926.1 cation-transporting P-type ATPase [Dactylosporangium aurantiacum]